MSPEEREIEVLHAMSTLSDCFSYDSPTYLEDLRAAAETYVDEINNPESELNQLAKLGPLDDDLNF